MCRRFLVRPLNMEKVYERMGWTRSKKYWKRRCPTMNLQEAAQLAMACDAPLGEFLAALAREMGIPALYTRLVRKPLALERSLKVSVRWVRCSRCQRKGHIKTSRRCPLYPKKGSPELERLKAKAVAVPRHRRFRA